MLGILLVDKPTGLSSHDAIYRVRRALGVRKIGHSGTLDPLATGLLVMAVGAATRFLPFLVTDPKTYVGTAALGTSTTTQDSEGEVVSERPVADLHSSQIEAACAEFLGEIEQIPPMYSAVKIGGERLYKLARKGVEVERQPRQAKVDAFECRSYSGGHLEFEVVCSAGTYVRTLIHDLGERLGVGAHMTGLRRTAAGRFNVIDACNPEMASADRLMPLEDCLHPMPMLRLPEIIAERVRHGNEFACAAEVQSEYIGIIDDEGLFAVARRAQEGKWQPVRAIPIGEPRISVDPRLD